MDYARNVQAAHACRRGAAPIHVFGVQTAKALQAKYCSSEEFWDSRGRCLWRRVGFRDPLGGIFSKRVHLMCESKWRCPVNAQLLVVILSND